MAERISVEEARARANAGQATLACACDDEARWARVRLPGARTRALRGGVEAWQQAGYPMAA
jgi:hypothetical protein